MIRLRWQCLAWLEARHDYFADGLARAMRFTPSAATAELIGRHQLLLRDDGRTLALHAPEAALDALRQALAGPPRTTLDFTVSPGEPGFAYYTEDPAPQTAQIDLGDGSDAAVWRAGLARRWTLQWSSRRSIWCYWLLGDWDEPVITLVDAAGQRRFDALGPLPFDSASGERARCFRSREPLALAERVPPGLQLRAGSSAAAGRVLVSQLPAPRPTALQFESGPGGRQAVSEIFVSR